MTTENNALTSDLGNGNSNDDQVLAILSGSLTKFEEQAITKAILANVKIANRRVETFQEWCHQRILIPAVVLAWKNKNPNIIRDILNGFVEGGADKSFRVESIAYWLEQFAGFRIDYSRSTQKYGVRNNYQGVSKHPNLDLRFTYDSHQLNTYLKNKNYRYWKVAPEPQRIIKVQDNPDKLFDALEKKIALGLIVGALDMQEVRSRAEKILANIEKDMLDQKIRDKAEDYRIQQLELAGYSEEEIDTTEPTGPTGPTGPTEPTVPSPTDTVVTETTNESPAS